MRNIRSSELRHSIDNASDKMPTKSEVRLKMKEDRQ